MCRLSKIDESTFGDGCVDLRRPMQARSQGGFGGFDRTPPFRGVYTAQYSQYTLCHTGLAGDRVHVYTISSNVVRLAAPRLHKRARRSKRAGVCNNN